MHHLLRLRRRGLGRGRVLGNVGADSSGGSITVDGGGGGIGYCAQVRSALGWLGRGGGIGRRRRHQGECRSLRGVEGQRVDRRRRRLLVLFVGDVAVRTVQRGQRGATGVDDPGIGGQVEAVLGEQRQLWVVVLVALACLRLAGYSTGYPSALSSSSTCGVSRGTRWWRGLVGTGRPSSARVASR